VLKSSGKGTQKKYTCFIGFEEAFNSVDRKILGNILNYYGLPDKLVEMKITPYKDSEYCVPTENGDTTFFKIMSGVKLGYILSLFLFVIVMDYILRQSSDSSEVLQPIYL
jgi:hypothetical protein